MQMCCKAYYLDIASTLNWLTLSLEPIYLKIGFSNLISNHTLKSHFCLLKVGV